MWQPSLWPGYNHRSLLRDTLFDSTVKLLHCCRLLSKRDLICPILFPSQTKASSEHPRSAVGMEVWGKATAGRASEFFWMGLVVSPAPSPAHKEEEGVDGPVQIPENLWFQNVIAHWKRLQRETLAKSMAFSYGNAAAVVVLPKSCAALKQRHNRSMSFLEKVINNLYYWMLLLCYLFHPCQELGGTFYPMTQLPICFHLSKFPVYSAPNSLSFSVYSAPVFFSSAPDRRQLFSLKVSLIAVSW